VKKAEFRGISILATIGLLVLLSFLSSTSLASTAPSPVISGNGIVQYTPTPPPAQTQYSYIISISGSDYQILNGATRALIYRSTSSSQVFNYLLGSSGIASAGSTTYVEAGAYAVDATWNIYKANVHVVFDSNAVLTLAALPGGQYFLQSYDNSILNLRANGIVITGGVFDGNGLNQYPISPTTYIPENPDWSISDGINILGSNCLVEYATVHNVRHFGIVVIAGYSNSGAANCKVYDVGANGIMAAWTNNNNCYFTNNEIYRCGDVGICSYSIDTKITGNNIHDIGPPSISGAPMYGYNNAGWAISIEGGTGSGGGNYEIVAKNTMTNCVVGVCIQGSGTMSYILVSGNTIDTCQQSGIQLGAWNVNPATNCIVDFNSLANCHERGILVGSWGSNTNVYGNTYSNCTVNFQNDGSGTITTQPSVVAVTVTSSPTGVGFVTANGVAGYAGSYSTSPYTFYAAVGNSVTLVANNVSGYTFVNWSDGGAQSHTISVLSSDQTYTATYS
jgi:hypothetical protein